MQARPLSHTHGLGGLALGEVDVVEEVDAALRHIAEDGLPVHGGARGGEGLRVRICA